MVVKNSPITVYIVYTKLLIKVCHVDLGEIMKNNERYIVSKDKIKERNEIFNSFKDVAKKVFKQSANKYRYVSQRDFAIDWEDLSQEFAASYLLYLDKKLQSGLVDATVVTNPAVVSRICQNMAIDILRTIDAQKRGATRLKQGEEFVHLDEVPEALLATTMNESLIVGAFLELLGVKSGKDYGISEEDWCLFLDYYVMGHTQKELLELYAHLDYSQQYLSRKLKTLGNHILPLLKQDVDNTIEH